MLSSDRSANTLLARMTDADFALLQPRLVAADLPVRKVLQVRGQKIQQVYFLKSGLASVVVSAGGQHSIEVGLIGREGVTGLSLIMGAETSPYDTFMQSAGAGWSLAQGALQAAMAGSRTLRDLLLLYGHTHVLQLSFTALANGRYDIGERLARWLLMAQDRSDSDIVSLTHDFLATMLGTRRAGVTTALQSLAKRGHISVRRGVITVIDRAGLEQATNGAYGIPEAEYSRLILRGSVELAGLPLAS